VRLTQERMTNTERRAGMALAGIYFLRMLGLFMILPVFSLHAQALSGATPQLVGLALGAYGLTQAVFQIPFGMLSDRFGRRPVIVMGLAIFAAGSLIAALSDGIVGVLWGRVLQGMGAIAATVMALAADLTREEQRTKVMALIGISIGAAFIAAFLIGPVVGHWGGLKGLFLLAALLSVLALALLRWGVPGGGEAHFHRECQPKLGDIPGLLRDPQLLRLNAGILLLHALLTATFIAVPLYLRNRAGLASGQHWQIYLPVFLSSVLLMWPFILMAGRAQRLKLALVIALALLGCSELGMYAGFSGWLAIALLLVGFFTAFNFLEASLPALISRVAPADRKGTALGIFSACQFLGAFLGGALGGWFHAHWGLGSVFLLGAALVVIWLALAITMTPPRYVHNHLIRLAALNEAEADALRERLSALPGVAEVAVIANEGVAYLKIDPETADLETLTRFARPSIG
jgi:MFS family permease